MRVGYCRESTTKAEQLQALAWQKQRLKQYGCDRVFAEQASGASSKRPEYKKMIELVQSGIVTEVVICSLTRLGRSLRQIQDAIDLFIEKQVKLTALDGSIDLGSASGRANVNLQAVFAQLERELIQERVSAGFAGVRANKYPIHAPFGYLIVDRALVINTEVEEIARWIRENVIAYGLIKTTQAINSDYPNVPKIPRTPGGIKMWLLCPTLYGHMRYNKRSSTPIIYRNNHPALFTEQERLEVEAALEFRKRAHGFKSDSTRFPFSGLVVCGVCGCNMQVSYTANRRNPTVYYRCTYWLRRTCTNNKYTPVPKIEKAVVQALVDRADVIAHRSTRVKEQTEDPKLMELRGQLKALEAMPSNPHIEAAIVAIREDIATLEQFHLPIVSLDGEREKKLQIYAQAEFWETIDQADKFKIYRLLIKKIVCNNEVKSVELWI